MIRISFCQFTRGFFVGCHLRAITVALIASVTGFAQADSYQPLQEPASQQQGAQPQRSKEEPAQTPPGNQPGYCADYEHAGGPECRLGDSDVERPLSQGREGRSSSDSLSTGEHSKRSSSYEPDDRISEPPTEFQRFVQLSNGRLLPIYGAWLFSRVPSTFAPLDQVPVTPEYALGPGDRINVRVWGQISFSQMLTLDRSGDVFLPQVGRISLSGVRFAQLQDAMKSSIGRVYKNFDINVNMDRLRSIQVFVVGQARRPGTYTIGSLSTLVNALFASGGPSSRGSMRRIELKRCDKLITTFDMYDLILRGDKSKDVPLQDGDVIFIPKAGPRVAITGSVENAAIYEITNDTTLGDALADAAGLSSVAAGKRAILERVNQHAALGSDDIPLTPDGLAKRLQDGDIIRLLSIVPRFENTITLRGNVADPVRLPWHEGMRVSDVIPDKEALLTRSYWSERNRLRDDRPENTQLAALQVPNQGQSGQSPANALLTAPRRTIEETSNTYREEPRNTSADRSLGASTSNQDTPPVRYFPLKNDVQPDAPDIDWEFASIERIDKENLTSNVISFRLGEIVIKHNASADIELQAGDVITIFSRADLVTPRSQESRLVRLEGEINLAGVYSVQPGETLRKLLTRAGGLSSSAYLYGMQFTRESLRREQQKRYSDFLDHLDRDISQSASTIGGRVLSADQGLAAQAAVPSQHRLVDGLRQAPVSGRIVFDLEPTSQGVNSLPDIPLENGDRIFIPHIPSTLNVMGTVYNQASFLYLSGFRLADYLNQAGGPTPYADKSHIFVIRANGSIIARETRSGPFSASFDSLRMYPGDTVVVPTNVTKTTRLRGLLDLSQVFSGFGLAAAAVNVLK